MSFCLKFGTMGILVEYCSLRVLFSLDGQKNEGTHLRKGCVCLQLKPMGNIINEMELWKQNNHSERNNNKAKPSIAKPKEMKQTLIHVSTFI